MEAREFTIKAPAKINLTLDVAGRRADGYHLIKTIMQQVTLFDEISFCEGGNGLMLTVINPIGGDIPSDERNIALRAARRFFEESGVTINGVITLKKQIPSEAGLGGGSSDAAAVLMGLNGICGGILDDGRIRSIAAEIGADVPFFTYEGAALCEGIGEIITPVPSLGNCAILIAKGEEGVSTAEGYRRIDGMGDILPICEHDEVIASLSVGDVASAAGRCGNIFDRVCTLDEVAAIKAVMVENGALCSLMSGSGSAVYGIFEKKKSAQKCLMELDGIAAFTALCEPYHGCSAE